MFSTFELHSSTGSHNMKICTLAVVLGLVAAAYSYCSDSSSVVVGPTLSISTSTSSYIGETISCADNPGIIVVNAELYSPVLSSRYIIVSIEYGCDGTRTLRCIDAYTGFVVCLPIFYDARVRLEVVVIPLTGDFAYFVPNGGCGGGFTFYLVYLDTCSGSVYLVDVLTGYVYIVEFGCYGEVTLVLVNSLPAEVIQLRREVRVELIVTFGVYRLFITDYYTQATYIYNLYELTSGGLLITSDNVIGLDYVLRISDCGGTVYLERAYMSLSGFLLTKTVENTFVRVTRSTTSIEYITIDSPAGVMPYVRASNVLTATIVTTTTTTLEITNINTGFSHSYSLFVGPREQLFVIDTQGNYFFVYSYNGVVTLFSVYRLGSAYYVVNANTKQIQLFDIDSSGSVVFYNADTISLSSLRLYRVELTYRITKIKNARYIIGEDGCGYSFKQQLRIVNNMFVFRDDLIQTDLLVIDTDSALPIVQECWITPGGIIIIDQITLRQVYVTQVEGQFCYQDVESGSVTYDTADSDYLVWMRSGCGTAVC